MYVARKQTDMPTMKIYPVLHLSCRQGSPPVKEVKAWDLEEKVKRVTLFSRLYSTTNLSYLIIRISSGGTKIDGNSW